MTKFLMGDTDMSEVVGLKLMKGIVQSNIEKTLAHIMSYELFI